MNKAGLWFLCLLSMFALAACPEDDDGKDETSTDDATFSINGEQFTEVGRGDYGIWLSRPDAAGEYCWFMEETKRISASGIRTSYRNICIDDESNCLAHLPDDVIEDGDTSSLRIRYDIVSGESLPGDCERLDAYWDDNDDVAECLFNKHCNGGQVCADYQCLCRPGDTCTCEAECAPRRSVCEGDTLVDFVPALACGPAGECVHDEVRTDCAASGESCDAESGTCADAGNQPGQP